MKHLYFTLILIGSLFIIGSGIRWTRFLSIQQITIKSNFNSIESAQLKSLLYPCFSKNLFNLSLNDLRRSIQILPEVESTSVYRKWPNHLEIELFLKEPIARWGDKGSYVSAYGDIFIPSSPLFSNSDLPILIGPQESIIKMLAYTQQMNKILIPLHMRIKTVELDAIQFWAIELNQGIKIKLGNENILERLKRWVVVYPKLVKSHPASIPKSIDLRYEHGMAVKWE